MEIVITHPSLDEYRGRLAAMAKKYACESWITLIPDTMTHEDRFEYSFIVSAVGEQLMQLECADIFQTPSHKDMAIGTSNEPGFNPGSFIFAGVNIECREVCRTY
jgi:hypothetical protein